MQKLHFVCKPNPDYYPFLGESYLYNSAAYLQLKAAKFGLPLTYYALDGNVAVARIHFFLQKKSDGSLQAVSLPESPFGSLEYGDISSHEIQHLVAYANENLWSKGVGKIIIKDCIEVYRSGGNFACEAIFLGAGYQKKDSFVNHHIPVDHITFEDKMQRMEQKRLRKCKRAMFHFQQEPMDKLAECYHFLKRCRREKGWELSLSLADLEQQLSQLPDIFCLFSVFHADERTAAALCTKVNSGILYDFYHDSLAAYKSYSPVTLLLEGVYHYCQQAGIRLLDMGTSPSRSLQAFKEHCGGMLSFKHTYQIIRR
jgi:hypothetical protein